MWETLIAVLVGVAIALLPQLLIECLKSNKENIRRKHELISRGRAKAYLITQILKRLAMYKVHKQYYARASKLIADVGGKEDAYKKHYEKGQEQRETELLLNNIISDYIQIATEYAVLRKNLDDFNRAFQNIFNYKHPKPSKFENCKTEQELVAELQEEETKMNESYMDFLGIIELIQGLMK